MYLEYLQSEHIRRSENDGDFICKVITSRGEKVPLTAEQIVHAKVEPHSNFGQSKIKVTLEIEIQAEGTAEYYQKFFAKCLLATIQKQREEIDILKSKHTEQRIQIEKFESDARAAAVVESAKIALNK